MFAEAKLLIFYCSEHIFSKEFVKY
jgi:hypothetical protein